MNCKPLSRVCAGISAFVGCSVLLGWGADIALLKSLFPGLVEMNPLTAASFILSGAALWPLRVPRFFAGAVILLASVRLAGCVSSREDYWCRIPPRSELCARQQKLPPVDIRRFEG